MNILIIESNQSGLKSIPTAKSMMFDVTFVQIDDYSPWPKTPENISLTQQSNEIISVPHLEDKNYILDIIAKLHIKKPFDFILPLEDLTAELATWIARKLNIKSTNYTALMNCRNKFICRKIIKSNYIASVPCEILVTLDDLDKYTGKYPAVIKPSFGKLSLNAFIVKNYDEARYTLKSLLSDKKDFITERGFLIEQYIHGELISVEVACLGNKSEAFMTTSRKRSLLNDAFELGSGMPSGISEDLYKKVTKYAESVVDALGLDLGMAHVELIIQNGQPILVEINPRIMGGPLEVIYRNVTGGENIYKYLLNIFAGQPTVPPKALKNTAVSSLCLFSNAEQILPSDFTPNWIKDNLPDILESRIIARSGEVIHKNSMIGFIFSIAETPKEAEYLCELAFNKIRKDFKLNLLT